MILTIPRAVVTALLDAVFGKAEPFQFTGSTLPRHTDTEAQR
jgi:hypothetical protein